MLASTVALSRLRRDMGDGAMCPTGWCIETRRKAFYQVPQLQGYCSAFHGNTYQIDEANTSHVENTPGAVLSESGHRDKFLWFR